MKEKNMSVPTTLIILISSLDPATGYSTTVTRCLPIEVRKIPKMFLNNNSNNLTTWIISKDSREGSSQCHFIIQTAAFLS